MFGNYFVVALRGLKRARLYAVLNVAGLGTGMAACMLILLFVQHERTYDRFHTKTDRIYRVMLADAFGGEESLSPSLPEAVVPAMAAALPEVEAGVRVDPAGYEQLVSGGGKQFYETGFLRAGPAFFDVFTADPVRGDLKTALARPGSVVITTTVARKYFGDVDPIGQTITVSNVWGGSKDYAVTAVVAPVPSNTHLPYDFAVYRDARDETRWNFYSTIGYVALREGADVEALRRKLPDFVRRHAHYDDVPPTLPALRLQPVTTIHLQPGWGRAGTTFGPAHALYLFSVVAVLILLIASVNFMNLATARATWRAREVGVRKTVGAQRTQLVAQFLAESMLTSLLALVLALMLVELTLPAFNALTGGALGVDYLRQPGLLLGFLGVAVVTGLFSGSYPAFFLSGFRPASVLKSSGTSRPGGAGLRRALVVFQFAAAVALLVATLVVSRQMDYVRASRVNVRQAEVVVLNQTAALGGGYEPFKRALLGSPAVASVATGSLPGIVNMSQSYQDSTTGTRLTLRGVFVGDDFLETMGLALVAGTGLDAETAVAQGRPVLLNEEAVRRLGLEQPVGQYVERFDITPVGVVRDFHFMPLYEPIQPLMIQYEAANAPFEVVVRLHPGHVGEGLAHIERTWAAHVPSRPLDFDFLDDTLDRAYRSELRLGRLFGTFAGLAVLIACLGLFGLAAFSVEQRTKEIGIRKALGATVPGLVALLSRDFVVLVLAAFVLAFPLAYLGVRRWLQDFAYHIELSWPLFAVAGFAILLLALLTVSYQTVRAARANPVKALRYE